MADQHLCVAIYTTHEQADEAFLRLRVDGSDMNMVSFVGRDYWKDMMGSRNAGERFLYRGNLGPFWVRLWSFLQGWGTFCFFEDGPLLVAGPLVRTIIATQEEGNGEFHTRCFEAALSGIGIPLESLVQYEKSLMNNHILVFVQGTLDEINHAQAILHETKDINNTIHHNSVN